MKKHAVNKNIDILDIGCGPGNMIKNLSYNKYYGFDTDKKYINYAKKKYQDFSFSSLPNLKL